VSSDLRAAREKMVTEQLVGRGITDARVLEVLRHLPREDFLAPAERAHAYEDRPLPIGWNQTISQPYIVARMLELVRIGADDRVLEVGSGCGYALAAMARLARQAYGLEIVPELAARAQKHLAAQGIGNVAVECRDGTLGWPAHEPYDAIVVSAGAPRVPALLLAQLADGGRLVIPVGERDQQQLVTVERRGSEFVTQSATQVRFVDLTGRYGWGGAGPPQA
jgi:protein-L-isoaspartate(D-aspartate) O-methyltransferase